MDGLEGILGGAVTLALAWVVVYGIQCMSSCSVNAPGRRKTWKPLCNAIETAGAAAVVFISVYLAVRAFEYGSLFMKDNRIENILMSAGSWLLSILTMSFFCMTRPFRKMKGL